MTTMSDVSVSITNYSEKAIVLRSQPEDYFKPYSTYLTQLFGRWNPNLTSPTGQGKLGGWIFSKKREQELRDLVANITSGSLQPIAPSYRKQSTLYTDSPIFKPSFKQMSDSPIPVGYQCIIKPMQGDILYLNVGGQKHPINIQSSTSTKDIVDNAIFTLNGQTSKMQLVGGIWQIPLFEQEHSITRV